MISFCNNGDLIELLCELALLEVLLLVPVDLYTYKLYDLFSLTLN